MTLLGVKVSVHVPAMTADLTAVVERALIVTGFAVLFFLLPHELFGDDVVRYHDAQQLLHHGHLTSSRYSLVLPIVSIPVLLLSHLVAPEIWWAARFNVIVAAVGTVVAYRLLHDRVDHRLLRRTLLVLLFASFFTSRLRGYDPEVLTATLAAIGIICLTDSRHVLAGWAALVVGVVNTPACIVGLGGLAVLQAVRTRRLRHLAAPFAAGALVMLENWIRRGGPLATGYAGNAGHRTIMPYSGLPGFSYPFLLGLVAILFSFGRGLLFFMPGIALWLGARTRSVFPQRRLMVGMLVFTGGLILVYAKWWAWYGGNTWGPRFFAFAAIPASLLLASRLGHAGESAGQDALTLGALALSAWVACSGAIAQLSTLSFCSWQGADAHEQLCWFTPDYSPLWQPVRQFPLLNGPTEAVALYCGAVFAYLAAPLVRNVLLAPRAWIAPALNDARHAGWRV